MSTATVPGTSVRSKLRTACSMSSTPLTIIHSPATMPPAAMAPATANHHPDGRTRLAPDGGDATGA